MKITRDITFKNDVLEFTIHQCIYKQVLLSRKQSTVNRKPHHILGFQLLTFSGDDCSIRD